VLHAACSFSSEESSDLVIVRVCVILPWDFATSPLSSQLTEKLLAEIIVLPTLSHQIQNRFPEFLTEFSGTIDLELKTDRTGNASSAFVSLSASSPTICVAIVASQRSDILSD
jgi:hypothetical protein